MCFTVHVTMQALPIGISSDILVNVFLTNDRTFDVILFRSRKCKSLLCLHVHLCCCNLAFDIYFLSKQRRLNLSVFLEALNLLRSTLEFLSLCFLRNAELSFIVHTKRVLRLWEEMHM
jgi:hypothetical protein